MKRPKQLPAVDRKSTKCASAPVGAKVGPSFNWDLVNTGFVNLNPFLSAAMSRP
jgi:hypothetical protein